MSDPSKELRPSAELVASLILPLVMGDRAPRLPGSDDPQEVLQLAGNPVYIALRSNHEVLAQAWGSGKTWKDCIVSAVSSALQDLDEPQVRSVGSIEVNLTHAYETLSPDLIHARLAEQNRGVLGVRVGYGDSVVQVAPGEMLANNVGFKDASMLFFTILEQDFAAEEIPTEERTAGDVVAEVFNADQVLISLRPQLAIANLFRGNITTGLHRVNLNDVEEFLERLGSWLTAEVQGKGWMVYLYHPSAEEASPENGVICQFIASLGLARYAEFTEDQRALELVERNLSYNLDTFYRSEGSIGYIQYNEIIRLGAAAVAGLALTEFSKEHLFAKERDALINFTKQMWSNNGSFSTFYKGTGDGRQNYYPGQTLLLWATHLESSEDPELVRKFMTSVEYYFNWHNENPHPAFVPWHTQAYYRLWKSTKKESLQKKIFQMNDWLLSWQQWETAKLPDERGRFFDPTRQELKRPHASFTANCLLSIIDAYELARTIGDTERENSYRQTVVRGFRSIMQLEFRNELDMYYLANPERVRGALRTSVYNNQIRVDVTPLALIAAIRFLEVFTENDFTADRQAL